MKKSRIYLLSSLLCLLLSCAREVSLSSQKLSEYNKPGIVYIYNSYQAQVYLPELSIRENLIAEALTSKMLQIASKRGRMSEAEIKQELFNAFIDELLVNLGKYAYIDETKQSEVKDVQVSFTGSGFIITPDGYIVTNAHVVQMGSEELKYLIVQQALPEMVQKDVQKIIREFKEAGLSLDEERMKKLYDLDAKIYAQSLRFNGEPRQEIYAHIGSASSDTSLKGYLSEIKKIGAASPGKDVAILKITASNLPTVSISDAKPMVQDNIIAIGYPGVATAHNYLEKSRHNLIPTITSGSISAIKQMATGSWEVYQHDAAITHGNSGGPLFNMKGEVIGINTFGSGKYNSNTGGFEEVQGFNFAVPTKIIEEFLSEINVKPSMSMTTQKYHRAVDHFFKQEYKSAKAAFKEIQEENPAYPYLQEYIEQSSAKINAGEDRSGFSWWVYAVGIGVLGLVLAIAIAAKKRKVGAGEPLSSKTTVSPTKAKVAAETPKPKHSAPAAGQQAQKYCSECGKPNVLSAKFCMHCGEGFSPG